MSKSMTYQSVTAALRDAIGRDERSQPKLADAAGVNKAAVFRFVTGERSLRLDSADRLFRALGFEIRLVRASQKRSKR
jgi:plasmid maintenance system antidote protein VapI